MEIVTLPAKILLIISLCFNIYASYVQEEYTMAYSMLYISLWSLFLLDVDKDLRISMIPLRFRFTSIAIQLKRY